MLHIFGIQNVTINLKKMIKYLFTLVIAVSMISCAEKTDVLMQIKTDESNILIDEIGNVVAIEIVKNATNYICQDSLTPLMTIRYKDKMIYPLKAKQVANGVLLSYENDIEAKIKILSKETYVTFELMSLSNNEDVDLIVWGPFSTTIDKVIGETIGVVQSHDFAV
ncbi:MAG: hypothetical protein KAH25_05515, partial [Bacteroidales bacterium]|nr:hypothetical protein [Bacteroidales bacterium]